MHDVFSDPHRRAVLFYLQERERTADVRELAEWVDVHCESEIGPDRPSAGRASWLLHRHVLSMDEFGLVEYDPEDCSVSLAEDVCVTVTPPWDDQ